MTTITNELHITANMLSTCKNPIEQQMIVGKLRTLAEQVRRLEKLVDEMTAEAMEDEKLSRIEADARKVVPMHPGRRPYLMPVQNPKSMHEIDMEIRALERSAWSPEQLSAGAAD